MKDRFLTEDECRAVGLTRQGGEALWEWVFARVGYLIGVDGTLGSGVFVRDDEDKVALLTAAHVVIPRVIQGALWVAAYSGRRRGDGEHELREARSRPANAVRVSTSSDAALVYVTDLAVRAVLDRHEWDSRAELLPLVGMQVVAAGMPGAWKTTPDLANRRIPEAGTLLLWTEVTKTYDDHGMIECKALKMSGDLPESLAGMSGGPVFTIDRRLLGIIESETKVESVLATQRTQWSDLHRALKPRTVPDDVTMEHVTCQSCFELGLEELIPVELHAQLYWSPRDPSYGGWGRVFLVVLDYATDEIRCVNIDWLFICDGNHESAARRHALEEQVEHVERWMRRHLYAET